jgi:hypothetical protein
MIRAPAVAGQFYPATHAEVDVELDRVWQPVGERRKAIAVMVPHAGWMYSGATAGKVYASVAVPDRVILVGPNHRNVGSRYAVADAGAWETPVGPVKIAEPLAAELLDACELLAEDPKAHVAEHSLEVQIPMLHRANPQVQIVPILIGGAWPDAGGRGELRMIGEALADVVRGYGRDVLMVASTDLNHYEDQETSRVKDKLALEAVVNLDEDGLMQRVRDVEVTMCGVAATYSVLVAAKRLGARRGELVDYRTSGEVSGDFARVVGYGGVIFG